MVDHHNKGRKQSAEHIAKRVEAWRLSTAKDKAADRFSALNKARAGKPLPEDTRRKQSEAMRGKQNSLGISRDESFKRKLSEYWERNREKHPSYRDGKSAERSSARAAEMGRLPYRLWRAAVFERDKWTCQDCGEVGGRLQADHIKPWSKFPELRYEVSNGRTLCKACHVKTPTYGRRSLR